jgi:hypothetical protein
MIKRTAILMTTAFMFVTLPGAAVADDQDQIRERLQDGSCLDGDYTTDVSGSFILADDQDRDREQLQDGSCLDGDYSTDSVNMILADGRQRDRDKDKDKLKDCKVIS